MDRKDLTEKDICISSVYFSGGLAEVEGLLENRNGIFLVCDSKLTDTDEAKWLAGKAKAWKSIVATEENKNIDTVLDICGWLLSQGADRKALVLAYGGGIVTDMVGFAASIYKRGVAFANIPTTLLAQVDAAIGGKTGVNYHSPEGLLKNMIGVINQPIFTFITPAVLASLPPRDFLSGAAEMLKSFIIEDVEGYYAQAVAFLKSYTQAPEKHIFIRERSAELLELTKAAASVKIGVVSRDQFEKGERRNLNLGHTFAHSIESLASAKGEHVTHGEAVAMGTVLAARLAAKLSAKLVAEAPAQSGPDKELWKRLREDFVSCGLPADCPYPLEEMISSMKQDKKAESGIVHFILPVSIGEVKQVDMSVEEAIKF